VNRSHQANRAGGETAGDAPEERANPPSEFDEQRGAKPPEMLRKD